MTVAPSAPVPIQKSRRPFVLWALIILHVLQAAVGLLALLFISRIDPNSPLGSEYGLEALTEQPFLLTIPLLLCLMHLVLAYGLWRLQRWAWVLTMVTLAISMGTDILAFIDGDPSYFSMFINVLLVFYLNQAEILTLFGAPAVDAHHE